MGIFFCLNQLLGYLSLYYEYMNDYSRNTVFQKIIHRLQMLTELYHTTLCTSNKYIQAV